MTSMQISITLNIASLVAGACAWLLGILAITSTKAITSHLNAALSFFLCTLSLLCQLFEIKNRVSIGDYAAIGDTIGAVLFAAIALIIITVVLNAIALVKTTKR